MRGWGRGGYREDISAIHSRGTRLFYEVNNMNKDSLHFLLSNNAFFFLPLLEWLDTVSLTFVSNKIMPLVTEDS